MKAVMRSTYGPPGVLRIQEIDKPTPRDNEVLVKVYATTVNRSDYHVLTGKPLMMRFFAGLFGPKLSITGSDFAGQIEATGKNVKLFKVGDKVMGFNAMGAKSHAQYLTIPEDQVVAAPANTTYEQTAACLEGAFYALTPVHRVKPQAGQKALIIGGTGAIGSSFVQFFKFYGVDVTAVCAGEHNRLVKSLGASNIMDYQTQDFKKDNDQYDFVFDGVGKYSFATCKHLLKQGGVFTSTGGFDNMFMSLISPLIGGKKVIFPIPKDLPGSLNFIKDLVEKGEFIPVIDRTYPLEKIAAAFTYVGTGQKIGNVIISMHEYPK